MLEKHQALEEKKFLLKQEELIKIHIIFLRPQPVKIWGERPSNYTLQLQQNRIVELLALNQNRSKLNKPSVPVSGWNSIGYGTFVPAFERLIESRTSRNTEKLYYLEQFPAGGVQELVQSCHYLPQDECYNEACMLPRKKFGNEYRMTFAYETKTLDWPNVRGEDGAVLERFSIFLESCKGAASGSRYRLRFDQLGNTQS